MIDFKAMPARPQQDLVTTPFHHYIFDNGIVWTEFHRLDDGYLLRFPDLADFIVSADGTEVIAWPAENVDETTLEHLYINQLMPLALSRQGRPAFHASVVAVPGGSVAFLGKTGMGKSTLAASFALDESAFLTDDALLVQEAAGGFLAMPSHASLRLWEDSVGSLASEEIATAESISYSSKTRLLAGKALLHGDEPLPLLGAYLLGEQSSHEVEIRPLNGLERYMAWVSNSFLLDIEDHELLARHFEWTHKMSDTIPTFALDYPRDYGILPDVRQAVRQHAANSGK